MTQAHSAFETQKSIMDWARETFGSNDPVKVTIRGLKEIIELADSISLGLPAEKIVDECADGGVMFMQTAELCGIDFFMQATLCEQDTKIKEIIIQNPLHAAALVGRYCYVLLGELATGQVNPRVLGMIALILETLVAHYEPGVTLIDAVSAKMTVNRLRSWNVDEHGRGQHVEHEPADDANTGHGHVHPRADGVRARCGGPGICAECSQEAARAAAPRHN